MALWRRNVFDFDDFEKNVSALFSDFRQSNNQLSLLNPHFDVRENDSHFTVHAELAGVKKDDIQLDFKQGVLHIKGEKKQEAKQDNEKCHVLERRFGSFERRMKFSTAANPEEIKATFNDGILEIIIPKAVEQNQESRILIN